MVSYNEFCHAGPSLLVFSQDVKFSRVVIHRSKFRRMDCNLNWSYFKHGELRCESVKIALKQWFLNSSLFLFRDLKISKCESGLEHVDNSLRLFCYCHFVIRWDRSRSAGLQKHLFHAPSSQGRSSVPSSALLCAGNLVNISSTQKLSWIPLFHARGRRTPSLWVTGTTRFESVDIICQIWPIRGYTRSWYTGTGRLKKWLQAPPPPLSPVSSCFIFVFELSQFFLNIYLGACNRLGMW